MRKLITLTVLFLATSITFFTNAQGPEAKRMLQEIEGQWALDNNNNVTVTKVIDVPGVSVDDLYLKALSYFTYNYNSGDDVVQVAERDKGVIIGKGLYSNVHNGITIWAIGVETYHVIRVDCKDEKVRVMVTLTQYRLTTKSDGKISVETCNISERFPVDKEGTRKTIMAKAFYYSFMRANNSIQEIEKALIFGNTGVDTSDW